MSDVLEYTRMIKQWESQPLKKTVTDILLRIQKLKKQQKQEQLNALLDQLTTFTKQANKAPKEQIQQQWFKQIQKCKNHLKSLLETIKKMQVKVPKLIKSNSNIQYPQQISSQNEQYQMIFKSLYKHFVINMDEQVVQKQKKDSTDFLNKVVNLILEDFGFNSEQKNKDVNKTDAMMNRINSITKQLIKKQATMAKKQMLQGIIKPDLVSKCDPKAFISVELQKLRQQRLDAIAKQNQTGFYDQLKKNINKDANQQCRFCHLPTAYCQGQKQIRASDEPMTRFMVCNSCGKRWRQE